MADRDGPDTVVLIHGLWMTALSWEHWKARYEGRGYTVVARSWPGMEGDIDALRTDPSGIAHLGIQEILDHYDAIIRALPTPPIIMGHSFGGAFAEILLDRGLGAAGVAIDAAAVKGILTLPLDLEVGLSGAQEPDQRPQGRGSHAEEFQVRVRQHPLGGGLTGRV